MSEVVDRSVRRRVWKVGLGVSLVAFAAAAVGFLFFMPTQGIKAEVARMRDEVGETITMMSLGGASEAVARHIPRLIDVTGRWNRKFASKSERFRGLDIEINQVQAMNWLGATAERWRSDLESSSPMQRNELWQKSIKAQVEAEQKKWPNLMHKKGAGEWALDIWKELWYGIKHGIAWPCDIYTGIMTIKRKAIPLDQLDVAGCLRYILFPYQLSTFTLLRLVGIVITTTGLGYLMCLVGLKSRFGWMSYIGLVYFLYLLNISLFIVWLEVTK